MITCLKSRLRLSLINLILRPAIHPCRAQALFFAIDIAD